MLWSEIVKEKAECLRILGSSEFDDSIRLQWNNRLGTSFGYCRVLKNKGDSGIAIVSFNPVLFQRTDFAECLKTVRHEICHAVEFFKFKRVSHSADWARLMIRLGEVPNICHREDVSDLRRAPRDKLSVFCQCGQRYLLSTIRRDRMANKERQYLCRKCRMPLELEAVSSRNF